MSIDSSPPYVRTLSSDESVPERQKKGEDEPPSDEEEYQAAMKNLQDKVAYYRARQAEKEKQKALAKKKLEESHRVEEYVGRRHEQASKYDFKHIV